MDARLFVCIEVPTTRDGESLPDGRHCATGTGYPVGDDLIVTARHVVEPTNRDPRLPIRVRWSQFPDFGDGGAVALDPDDRQAIAYRGDCAAAGDGIVLLRCPKRPPGVSCPAWPWGSASDPIHGAAFRSIGYPAATRFADPATDAQRRTQHPFEGQVRTSAEPWFAITDVNPPDADAWRGASGMPIFVDGRIIGVFSYVLQQAHGTAHALPIAPLLNDSAFNALFVDARARDAWQRAHAEAMDDIAWQRAHAQAMDDIASILAGDPTLAKVLRQQVAGEASCHGVALGADADPDTKAVARCLLQLPDIAAFARIMQQSNAALRGGLGAVRPADAHQHPALRALLAVLLRAAPYLYDESLARTWHASLERAEVMELPAALYAVAELIVAAAEGRPAEYQGRLDERDWDPRGFAALSSDIPELGLDADPQTDYCDSLLRHLGRKELGGGVPFDEPGFLAGFDQFLSRLYPRGRPPPADDEDQRAAVNRELGFFPHPRDPQRPCRLYTVFRPETADELAQMQSTAHKLHERYPNLRVVLLASAQNEGGLRAAWDREYERLRGFCTLLPLRRGADTPS